MTKKGCKIKKNNLLEEVEIVDLSSLVESLCTVEEYSLTSMKRKLSKKPLPSREDIICMVEALRSVLFPGYFGSSDVSPENICFQVGSTLDGIKHTLEEQIMRGLCFVNADDHDCSFECEGRARTIANAFLSKLPVVRQQLAIDVQASYEGDPAATSPAETIFCYPGVLAITNYRLAHELHVLSVPIIPRMITEHAHSITGIDIHPGTSIGESFFIDHGTGVVIGETSIIGDRVRIYQGVTLGAKSFPLDENGNPIKGIDRHPILEDDVIIYSGATILGRVVIGKGSVIGGNVWLTHDVPPGSRITQIEAR